MNAMLRAENVSVARSGRMVVSQASLDFAPGEITALVGPNGAGKSSLLLALAGLLPCRDGSIALGGQPLKSLSLNERARKIAFLPQRREAAWPLSVRDVVLLGRFPADAMFSRASDADDAAAARAMQDCDVAHLADRPVDRLSGGEQARVLLARALAVEAPVLLADEPLAGLDPAHQFAVLDILRARAARGATVVIALHELSLVAFYTDRVAVLDRGTIVAQGAPMAALDDGTLARVFDVEAARLPGGEWILKPRRGAFPASATAPEDRK